MLQHDTLSSVRLFELAADCGVGCILYTRIYVAVLESSVRDRMFFGLGSTFVSWEKVARAAIELCGSTSLLQVEDLGWPEKPALFDVSAIRREFGLQLDPWKRIVDHLRYHLSHP